MNKLPMFYLFLDVSVLPQSVATWFARESMLYPSKRLLCICSHDLVNNQNRFRVATKIFNHNFKIFVRVVNVLE